MRHLNALLKVEVISLNEMNLDRQFQINVADEKKSPRNNQHKRKRKNYNPISSNDGLFILFQDS